MMHYHFKTHREGTGYWAQCVEIPGCVTQGKNMKELNRKMQEAINLAIEESPDSNELADLPDDSIKTSKTMVEVPIDPQIDFAFMLRYQRIKHGMTATAF